VQFIIICIRFCSRRFVSKFHASLIKSFNPYLEVLAELLVELLEVILVLTDVVKQLHALLDKILTDDLEDLALLEGLAGDVQWEIFRVNDSLHKAQVLWDQLLAVVHDEDASDVQLDVVALLLVLKQVKGRTTGHKEESTELQLTLH